LVPFPAAAICEAAGARLIDKLAGQSRLVAGHERLDNTLATRFLGKQRSGKHVGFNIDHDDMPTGGDRRVSMGDPGRR
jgi:hypothetical protein